MCFDSSAQADNNLNRTPGTTNPALWNALNGTSGAIAKWNTATYGGASSGYYLQYNCSGTPDVVITYQNHAAVSGDCSNAPLSIQKTTNQLLSATINTSEWLAQSLNSSDIVTALSHEFGHIFGLNGTTNSCASVMGQHIENGPGKQCNPASTPQPTTSVSANDVRSAQNVINRSSSCTGSPATDPGYGTDGPSNPAGTLCSGTPPIACPGFIVKCDPTYGWYCSNQCIPPEPLPFCQECRIACKDGIWTCVGSPVVLDAFGTGFHFTDIQNGVRFRVMPSQELRQMSWPNAAFRNGWLALDRNGDGKITDFTELFGNATPQPKSDHPNGYLALAVFDAPENGGNGNGFIDSGRCYL